MSPREEGAAGPAGAGLGARATLMALGNIARVWYGRAWRPKLSGFVGLLVLTFFTVGVHWALMAYTQVSAKTSMEEAPPSAFGLKSELSELRAKAKANAANAASQAASGAKGQATPPPSAPSAPGQGAQPAPAGPTMDPDAPPGLGQPAKKPSQALKKARLHVGEAYRDAIPELAKLGFGAVVPWEQRSLALSEVQVDEPRLWLLKGEDGEPTLAISQGLLMNELFGRPTLRSLVERGLRAQRQGELTQIAKAQGRPDLAGRILVGYEERGLSLARLPFHLMGFAMALWICAFSGGMGAQEWGMLRDQKWLELHRASPLSAFPLVAGYCIAKSLALLTWIAPMMLCFMGLNLWFGAPMPGLLWLFPLIFLTLAASQMSWSILVSNAFASRWATLVSRMLMSVINFSLMLGPLALLDALEPELGWLGALGSSVWMGPAVALGISALLALSAAMALSLYSWRVGQGKKQLLAPAG